MKIATWNVERLKHRRSLAEIIAACEYTQADILILTENDEAVKPKYQNCCHTPTPPALLLQVLCYAGHDLCICGDHNCSFSDNYYFTNSRRERIVSSFSACNIKLITAERSSCIDHIAVSERFLGDSSVQISEWNTDKALSDHKGICVQFDHLFFQFDQTTDNIKQCTMHRSKVHCCTEACDHIIYRTHDDKKN